MKENSESFMEMTLSEKSVTMQHDLKTIWRERASSGYGFSPVTIVKNKLH